MDTLSSLILQLGQKYALFIPVINKVAILNVTWLRDVASSAVWVGAFVYKCAVC